MPSEPPSWPAVITLRVLPYWPRDRYLELAPKYWRATRGRLSPNELASPLCAFEVPPPPGETVDMVPEPVQIA
jgi:hypothetical protein